MLIMAPVSGALHWTAEVDVSLSHLNIAASTLNSCFIWNVIVHAGAGPQQEHSMPQNITVNSVKSRKKKQNVFKNKMTMLKKKPITLLLPLSQKSRFNSFCIKLKGDKGTKYKIIVFTAVHTWGQ